MEQSVLIFLAVGIVLLILIIIVGTGWFISIAYNACFAKTYREVQDLIKAINSQAKEGAYEIDANSECVEEIEFLERNEYLNYKTKVECKENENFYIIIKPKTTAKSIGDKIKNALKSLFFKTGGPICMSSKKNVIISRCDQPLKNGKYCVIFSSKSGVRNDVTIVIESCKKISSGEPCEVPK
jgi:Na+-transporting methylmalonyl-CoA/oxaloacetate decarboxylase gamma subunit